MILLYNIGVVRYEMKSMWHLPISIKILKLDGSYKKIKKTLVNKMQVMKIYKYKVAHMGEY